MRLKKLNIYGFKSFAEKTSLVFEKQIIALVGPNGCGKSNIVDAILWVFQRGGLKNLRAREKQDLIFKGNDTRKQTGFAEVEVIFEDQNSIDVGNDIRIKKRLYQSGETEVFIEDKPVTLKELENFFMNHNIYSLDYSIITQGNIESVISSKPEEKRALIEEAANIKKNRIERDEALTKLKKAQENINQLDILLSEITNELNKLYEQAEKAKKFKEFKNILIDSEKKLFLKKYLQATNELRENEENFENFEKKNNELLQKIDELEALSKEKKSIIEEVGNKVIKLREKVIKIDGEITSSEKTIGFYRQIIEDLQNQLTSKLNNMKIFKNKKKDLEYLVLSNIDEEEEKLFDLNERLEEYKIKIDELNEQIETKLRDYEKIKEEEEELNKELNELTIKERDIVNKQVSEINNIIYKLEKNKKNEKEYFSKELEKLNLIKMKFKSKLDFLSNIYSLGKNLDKENLKNFIKEFSELENIVEDLKSIINNHYNIYIEENELLFSDNSLFKLREETIIKIDKIHEKLDKIRKDKIFYEEEIKKIQKLKEFFLIEKSNIENEISITRERIKNVKNQKDLYRKEIIEINYQIQNLNDEIAKLNIRLQESKDKVIEVNKQRDDLISEKAKIDLSIKENERDIDKYSNELLALQKEFNLLFEEKKRYNEAYNNFSSLRARLETQLETLRSLYFENYREDILLIDFENIEIPSETTLRKNIKDAQKNLEELGEVNLLAIDEYEDIKKRHTFLVEQKNDMIKSMEDIKKVIDKLNEELSISFLNTFNEINKNFQNIFKRVFGGGEASLILTDPQNILETGVDIKIQPPGKKINYLNLLSGGEKSMSAISLLFALFLYKPSPFCIMDEVDAALDELNVERYKKLLVEFSEKTQFIIISHNKITLEISDILYGVTMEESGVSKVISAKLEKIQ